MSEEPLFKYATALSLAGRTMCEVGLILKHGVLVCSSRLGEVSRLMKLNHVGKGWRASIPTSSLCQLMKRSRRGEDPPGITRRRDTKPHSS